MCRVHRVAQGVKGPEPRITQHHSPCWNAWVARKGSLSSGRQGVGAWGPGHPLGPGQGYD